MLSLSEPVEETLGDRGVEQVLSGTDCSNRSNQVATLDLLQDVTGGTGHDRREESLIVRKRGQHQDLRFR